MKRFLERVASFVRHPGAYELRDETQFPFLSARAKNRELNRGRRP